MFGIFFKNHPPETTVLPKTSVDMAFRTLYSKDEISQASPSDIYADELFLCLILCTSPYPVGYRGEILVFSSGLW